MAVSKKAGGRVSIVDDEIAGTRVVITHRGLIAIKAFLTFWLGFWLSVEATLIVRSPMVEMNFEGSFIRYAMLIFWTIVSCVASVFWTWLSFGREVIFVRESHLVRRREVFGLGLESSLALAEIRDLRYDVPQHLKVWPKFLVESHRTVLFNDDLGERQAGFCMIGEEALFFLDALKILLSYENQPES